MAKEYIEREEVREAFRMEFDNEYADDITDRLPTADVQEVRHGKWKYDNIALKCSECDKWLVIEQGTADMNFCPHCGAKMDKE